MASSLSHIVYIHKPSTLDAKVVGFRTKSYCVYTQYDLVRKTSTLDTLIGYFTPSHVIHQRLLLQFLSAPEDGRQKSPKHVEHYCSY